MAQFDLLLEDCVEGMARLPFAAIDLVVTSPPYNLDIKCGKYSDRQGSSAEAESSNLTFIVGKLACASITTLIIDQTRE